MHKSIRTIIGNRNLVSVMNNTKWNKLASFIEADPEKEPRVSIKSLFENKPTGFSLIDWDLEVHNCTAFEWVDIDPVKKVRLGEIIPDREIDLYSHVEVLLRINSIPYSIENGCFRVWGYHVAGQSPKFI